MTDGDPGTPIDPAGGADRPPGGPAPAAAAPAAPESPAATGGVEPAAPSRALVFVSGLDMTERMEPHHVAEIIAWELDQRADDRLASFAVRVVPVGTDAVHRVERLDGDVVTPLLDLYHLDPGSGVRSPAASALGKVVTLAIQVLAGIMILVRAWLGANRRAKSFAQTTQLLFCLFVLLCLGAYFLTAVYALFEAVRLAIVGANNTITWPQWVVLVSTVVGVLFPGTRERVAALAEQYLRMMRYLWTAAVRNHVTGRIAGLVDRVNRRPEITEVHLAGFSFGSLAVLDTVYPGSSPTVPTVRQLASIVTIGCPFDLVRMVRPSYVVGRGQASAAPPRWINVYAPTDVLASNFTDGDAVTATADRGLTLADGTTRCPDVNLAWNRDLTLSLPDFVLLQSLRVHGQYWDETVGSRTALGDPLVEILGPELAARPATGA